MKVILGCEESQEVCKAFRELGHEAYSCDIQQCSGGHPEWHILADIFSVIESDNWDMGIFFPPCTKLCVSGARWHKTFKEDGSQDLAIGFFLKLANCGISKIAVENPIGIMSRIWRKPDQIIQPYWFGHPERKSTCLWLKGLPKLKPTNNVYAEMMALPKKERERIHYCSPGPDRAKIRSKTFIGVAKAMAEQWGGICSKEAK